MLGGDELVHREVLSPNHGPRTLPISMVVLHYTEMKPVETALERMCDPATSVSAHYCITEEGEVIRLVPEDRRGLVLARHSRCELGQHRD
jgi:N-acetylmuramoyl-L-alanine amidase